MAQLTRHNVPLTDQVRRLTELGVADLAGITSATLAGYAADLPDTPDAILVVHPTLVPPRALASLLCLDGKPGFVVDDLTDLEQFVPITEVQLPDRPLYVVRGIDRGDDLRNASPTEALAVFRERGRTPLTVGEGISWLLHEPEMLQRNHCFMTIGSRKAKGTGLDARTPAIWISGGTGHDGRANAGAPKVGWCWAGNRHTWLGFASAAGRAG